MDESSEEFGVEVREEMMVSIVGGGNPTERVAHFLKPCINSIKGQVFELPANCLSSIPVDFQPKKWPLKLKFYGWSSPQKDWKIWVGKMAALHESTWKKVGIHEAILNSTYEIQRNYDLVLGLAEKWCSQTKSFIFPWGEATITLEDMMISGYSVLGSPVFRRLEIDEMEVEEKLNRVRMELANDVSRKASQSTWLKKFMDSRSEIEHEAFLALWLSRFVFPLSRSVVCKAVLPIAVHLARGNRLALAPAILASIYRDLSVLKEKIVAFSELVICEDEHIEFTSNIRSPFHLVQIWAWERFIGLRPMPNPIKNGEPRFARWHKIMIGVENVRTTIDSAKEGFLWRPYVRTVGNWDLPKFYGDEEMWLTIDADLTEEFQSFARCLRISNLVGLDCIEQYLPHRVAMQFGLDQDLPACVARVNESRFTAWKNYSKPITNANLYIPSRFSEADVTTRYLMWWKKSLARFHGATQNRSKDGKKSGFPGFGGKPGRASEKKRRDANASFAGLTLNSEERSMKIPKEEKEISDASASTELPSKKPPLNLTAMKEADNSPVPPGFPLKSDRKENLAVTDSLKSGKKDNDFRYTKFSNGECSSHQSLRFSPFITDNNEAVIEPLSELASKVVQNGPANCGPETLKKNATERKASCVGQNDGDGKNHAIEMPEELEDRVSRLEKIVRQLKAERFSYKSPVLLSE